MTLDPLWVDLYANDLGGKPDIQKFIDAGLPWWGLIIKATQGDYYSGGGWFRTYWPLIRQLAINASRYRKDFVRGCYHYFDLKVDARVQAEYFLRHVELAGGWDWGDLAAMIDVEESGNPGDVTASQIVDGVSTWTGIVETATGTKPILYGGNYLAEHGVTDHCGCQALVVARYSAKLPPIAYTRIGWTAADLVGWQYAGVPGGAYLKNYPKTCPMGSTDIIVNTIAGHVGAQAQIDYINAHYLVLQP